MTTDLLKLSDAVKKDTPDKVIDKAIRERVNDIRKALRDEGKFELPSEGGKFVIRKKSA